MIAVLGGLSIGRGRARWARCAPPAPPASALLIDPSTWLNLPEDRGPTDDRSHDAAALTLLRTGWRVVGVEHGTNLAALWPQAARGSQGFAWRAALAETVAPRPDGRAAMSQRHPYAVVAGVGHPAGRVPADHGLRRATPG